MSNKKLIISLGGSIVNSAGIDSQYILGFVKFIKKNISKYKQVIIIVGGGALCREYQQSAKNAASITDVDLDKIGIASTRINAEVVRSVFGKSAYKDILLDPKEIKKIKAKIVISGGFIPGRSSDDTAVRLAIEAGGDTVINMSNVNQLYDRDPKVNKDAVPIDKISWKEALRIIGDKRSPGGNYPFDPVASRLAKQKNVSLYIVNGKDLDNLQKLLSGKPFAGTIIT